MLNLAAHFLNSIWDLVTTMKNVLKTTVVLLSGLFAHQAAHGALVINFQQAGPDVVISASGTLDVSGLTLIGSFLGPSSVSQVFSSVGDQGFFRSLNIGDQNYELPMVFPLFSNNVPFTNAVSAGDSFGIFSDEFIGFTDIYVPAGFTSGSINGTMTLANTDLSTLGVIPLPSLTWGPGAGQGLSITTSIAAIPEPSTYLAMAGFIGLGLFLWLRRKSVKAPIAI